MTGPEIEAKKAELTETAKTHIGKRYEHPIKGAGTIFGYEVEHTFGIIDTIRKNGVVRAAKGQACKTIYCNLKIEYDVLWEHQMENCGRHYDVIPIHPVTYLQNFKDLNEESDG